MDPKYAFEQMLEAAEAGDFDAAQDALEALEEWHERGGFLTPEWREGMDAVSVMLDF